MKKFFFGSSTPSPVAVDLSLTLLRVGTGLAIAMAHGFDKIPPSRSFIGVMGGMGLPLPAIWAWLVAFVELGGGLLLAVGLLARPAALSLSLVMAVSFFLHHGGSPFAPNKELAFLYLLVSLCFIGLGGGRISVDRLVRHTK